MQLYYVEGLEPHEIVERTGIHGKTVQRIHRSALEKLKRAMAG